MKNKEAYDIIKEIRFLLDELEGELSDPGDYKLTKESYDEVLTYYQTNDNDGEYN